MRIGAPTPGILAEDLRLVPQCHEVLQVPAMLSTGAWYETGRHMTTVYQEPALEYGQAAAADWGPLMCDLMS